MDQTLTHWGNFYILMGSGAATLIGLMFIALTFGSKLVTQESVGNTRSILSPIIYHFAQAFTLSAVALIPNAEHWLFASVSIGLALLRLFSLKIVYSGLKMASQQNHDIERSDWIFGMLLPTFFYLMFILFGGAMLIDLPWAADGLGVSVMGILILGIATAWDMLIWMAIKIE